MLVAAAAHNIFRDWTTYVVTGLGIISTLVVTYIRTIKPLLADRKKHEEEKAQESKDRTAHDAMVKKDHEDLGLVLLWIAKHEQEGSHG